MRSLPTVLVNLAEALLELQPDEVADLVMSVGVEEVGVEENGDRITFSWTFDVEALQGMIE